MNVSECNDKCKCLKELLSCWSLLPLYETLQEEDIYIEELKMMKVHHFNELLRNFKLGTRIRFEHFMEKWRHSINRPLDVGCSHCNKNSSKNIPCTIPIFTTTKTNNIETIKRPVPTQDVLNDDIVKSQTLRKAVTPLEASKHEILQQPKQQQQQQQQPLEDLILNDKKVKVMISDSSIKAYERCKENDSEIKSAKTVSSSAKWGNIHIGVSVANILRKSGRKGIALMQYYKKYKNFTEDHRQLLLQLIVNYFDLNDYHLSLGTSYQLENQILQLFPTERLEHYRTERRGRIYVKFCNLKRKRTLTSQNNGNMMATANIALENTHQNEEMNQILQSDNHLYNEVKIECE